MKQLKFTATLLLLLIGITTAQGQVFVDKDATAGANNGSSWTDAYTDLQGGIDAAMTAGANTEVWVAAGTYLPTESPDGTTANSRDNAFHFDIDIKIYGGFDGTETMLSQRNAVANVTILSGDIGTLNDDTDNAYHIMITEGLTSTAIIDGFTFKDGKADGSSTIPYSGGTFYRSSGGGMYNISSSPTLNNVSFSNNSASLGGGMENSISSPTLNNVSFSNNSASYGGGMQNSSSSPTLNNVSFSNNSATINGGGMENFSSSSPTLYNTVFYGNTASSSGNDIDGDHINATSSHNASDYTGGNINAGTGFLALAADPFTNSSDPDGADNIWRTADDGLALASGSPLVGAGTATNAPTTDIIGTARPNPPSIGAYEEAPPLCKAATLLYVNHAATGNNTGETWANAFTNLQDALDCADAGESIWVAAGTYLPTDAPNGTTSTGSTDRNNAFHFNIDIKIYGGFDGTETLLSQQDAATNITILSGDIGTSNDDTDNAYHIMITEGLTSTAIIDGFTFKDGKADGSSTIPYSGGTFDRSWGGGMQNSSSSPTLNNVSFSNNSASLGGGMFNYSSSPTLNNVSFSNNFANNEGGGMFNLTSSSPTLNNVSFSNNSASYGGGMQNFTSSSPTLNNVSFSNNSAIYGGGMENYNSSSPTLYNTVFYGNTASSSGNDINGDNINASSSHNASDYTGGSISAGTGFLALAADPFTNSSDPDGADNIWRTADDGLALASGSPLVGAGTATNAPTNDIIGTARPNPPSIGAYELFMALPIELLYFTGETTDNGNLLTWQTASEENNAGFEVQKSINGLDFQTIGFVEGNGTTLEIQSYEFLDENTTKTINYYRLKQVDFDGVFDYSPIVTVNRALSNDEELVKLYPNPVQNELTIENITGTAQLFNALGQQLRVISITNTVHQIDVSDLPKGQYFMSIQGDNGQHIVKRFMK